MDEREEALVMIQRAVWLSDKLARLCRELVKARAEGRGGDEERLKGEIQALIRSDAFAAAVSAVGRDCFYPRRLRAMEELIRRGLVQNIQQAAEKTEEGIVPQG